MNCVVFWPRWENHRLLQLLELADHRIHVRQDLQYYWGECLTQHKYPSNHTPETVLGPFRARRLFRSSGSHPLSARHPSSAKCTQTQHTLVVSIAASYIAPCRPPSHQSLTLPSGEPRVNHIPRLHGSPWHEGELWCLSWCSLFRAKPFQLLQLSFNLFPLPSPSLLLFSECTWFASCSPSLPSDSTDIDWVSSRKIVDAENA